MSGHKFDVKKLDKLNNPKRLEMIELGKIVNELQLLSNSVLVDIGAGTGMFSEKLLDLVPDSKCYALDISKEMIEWIDQNRVPKLKSRLKTKLMGENNIPLEDNTADLAFMITVHHELEDGEKLLKEIKRVLKEDGKVLICDWKEGCHHHFVKKDSIIEDLKLAGFNTIKEIEASEKLVCLIGY
ncbi:class I SAM-dependent methyltransferase [Romboutsia sp.]|uniref:class I SAM-dependent methyltransferase n=1 Tax=Romboutsia sp. TaxID=1965302 RepID=UPI002CA92697|nr:class I SAM-dependent methyltransferase [Romboutsia sp.]HSQ90468.1 class I SAM-dependent methyltransferase [Romboutsia sp.]